MDGANASAAGGIDTLSNQPQRSVHRPSAVNHVAHQPRKSSDDGICRIC
jgi:hypothetical protein